MQAAALPVLWETGTSLGFLVHPAGSLLADPSTRLLPIQIVKISLKEKAEG